MTQRSPKLSRIDLRLHTHRHLGPDDQCFYLREFTAYQGYRYSQTNDLIHNFKKSPDRRDLLEWSYKAPAITQIISELRAVLPEVSLRRSTLVPIPPSKPRYHEHYDSRMLDVLAGLGPYDIRDLLICDGSLPASHISTADRPSPEAIRASYTLDREHLTPPPEQIVIFDDVLVNGAHFRAASDLLHETFEVPIYGVFVARCVFTVP